MGFFDNAEEIEGNTYEVGGGDFEPIPNNTNLLVVADSAEWTEWEGEKFVQIKWVVLAPSLFAKRNIFQKIKVFDNDSKKARRAITMLKVIDINCGNELAKLSGKPTDTDLMKAIMGKQLVVKVQIWDLKDDSGTITKSGNWVCSVSPKAPVKDVKKEKVQEDNLSDFDNDISDHIPF